MAYYWRLGLFLTDAAYREAYWDAVAASEAWLLLLTRSFDA